VLIFDKKHVDVCQRVITEGLFRKIRLCAKKCRSGNEEIAEIKKEVQPVYLITLM